MLDAMISLSLLLIVFSKEKIDDERTKQIRFFTIKTTFSMLIGLIVITNMYNYQLDLTYIPTASLLFYLIVFYLSNYFNPSFIFVERISDNKSSDRFLLIIMTFFAFAFSYDIISSIV